MENMRYAEELVREFLVFRGFTSTLQEFESELSTDVGRDFQSDKILNLILLVYVPNYQADKLVGLLNFFKKCFSSPSEVVLISTLSKLEVAVLRYYIVNALQSGRQDKVLEFFQVHGNYLLQKREDWLPWFAISYLKNPGLEPLFRVYFSKEWHETFVLSLQNFLSEIFNGTRLPALLKISTEKNTIKRLKTDLKQLNCRLSELQAVLEMKEAELLRLRGLSDTVLQTEVQATKEDESSIVKSNDNQESGTICIIPQAGCSGFSSDDVLISDNASEDAPSSTGLASSSLTIIGNDQVALLKPDTECRSATPEEDKFPEVKFDFQESFLGHTSPISRCRFSGSGGNIASASMDGTVRIWTYDSSTPTSRNATIYCGAEIASLDWESRSDRLLLIGTADGGIKAWNVDAKRVVCDLSTSTAFPSVLDIKCSPVDPIFVSAAASGRMDKLGFASLTVWNMKTWKPTIRLPLGEDPPAITSVCFNHNGKILAASATDGMIHMFDIYAGLQITGWPAHDTAVSSVLFGPDETSIFSLGSDGKIFEWSLHNQGQILWSRDCNRFCRLESTRARRHEIALDSNGRRLLVTSASFRSPIYQVQGHMSGLRTLPHSAAVTTVDWHPSLPIFLTGSADHSVRITAVS